MSKEDFKFAFLSLWQLDVYPVLACDRLSENEYVVKY